MQTPNTAYTPHTPSRQKALLLKGSLAEGEGFEPPRAWRPLRFSRAPFDVLSGVAGCRPDTNHDPAVVAPCRLVPPSVVGVGV
jgi:hypothetical protein